MSNREGVEGGKGKLVETCGTCGHLGERGNPHDCYWVFVERGRSSRSVQCLDCGYPVPVGQSCPRCGLGD